MLSRWPLAVVMLMVAGGAAQGPRVGGSGQSRADGAAIAPDAVAAVVRYVAPVQPLRVVRPFQPPPDPYAAGHRGVDLQAAQGVQVRSAAAGTVRFAGSVAGRGVVVVLHADGISTEYEPVTASVRAGASVGAAQPIGRVHGAHSGCAGSCLHWGARRGSAYLDPLSLLRPLGPVVLLPWPRDG